MDYKVFCDKSVEQRKWKFIVKGNVENARVYFKKMNEWEFLKLKRKRESLKFELKEINQKIQREEEIRERIEIKEQLRDVEIKKISNILKVLNARGEYENIFLDCKHEDYEIELKRVLKEYLDFLEYYL